MDHILNVQGQVSNLALSGAAWRAVGQERVEQVLASLLPAADEYPAALHQAMRYAVLGGGKRVRPLLVYAAGVLSQATNPALDHCAAAVELIHCYSLVHDDLPCMDDDALRRGKPTCHVVYGEANALLVGDALQTLAFKVLADLPEFFKSAIGSDPDLPPMTAIQLIKELALASGSRGMCGGQATDLECVGQTLALSELEQMHQYKTGALLRAAIRMGASCGEGSRQWNSEIWHSLDRFARAVGLAFQVTDDLLDATGHTHLLGKTAGKDAQQRKPTYVTMLGLEAAKQHAEALYSEAIDTLSNFGDSGLRLRELTEYLLHRQH